MQPDHPRLKTRNAKLNGRAGQKKAVLLAGGRLGAVTYFETSALIITLIRVGKYLEAVAKGRTSAAIKALMGLQPKTARVVRGGVEQDVPVEEVRRRGRRPPLLREEPPRPRVGGRR